MRGPPSVQRVSGAHACAGAHENHEMPRADGCGVCILILHHTRTSTCSICPVRVEFCVPGHLPVSGVCTPHQRHTISHRVLLTIHWV